MNELRLSRIAALKFVRAREVEDLCACGNRYSIDLEVKNKLGSLCLVSLEGSRSWIFLYLALFKGSLKAVLLFRLPLREDTLKKAVAFGNGQE